MKVMEEGKPENDLFTRYDAIIKAKDSEQNPEKKELYEFMQTSLFEGKFDIS